MTSLSQPDPLLWHDWHVVGRMADLPPETVQAVQLLGVDLVLWRGSDGGVQVWGDRCPHRSVRFSAGRVRQQALVCAYHGMAFGQDGRCLNVPVHPGYEPPSQACAQVYEVKERYGLIYACLGNPSAPPPPFPEWDDVAYRTYSTGPYHIRANGLRAVENFLDVGHFPYLHSGILGDVAKPQISDYDVTLDADGVRARDIRVWQPNPLGTGAGAYVTYEYWAMRPLSAYFRKTNPTGDCLTFLLNVTPIDETQCIAWFSGAMNYGVDLPLTDITAFQNRIVAQDLENLEAHNPQALPLEGGLEFHVPSDRTSLMYRKWLKQLGLTYGVYR
ncbi:MAG: aromatic ring-hydroxylating dioxygenase subunit alpha [Kaiparowitsia implicata GSE-PSE-MK54-09C]|jgi:phenylpropionate dioxygenase-like ring-hydroxylating dioxygenase large terminal subunit|nr:aromatic ring-hydroxylating dioxygenase subunit alpha [Kaiparowitsia implicata GSE-PSE-MK54-09C]